MLKDLRRSLRILVCYVLFVAVAAILAAAQSDTGSVSGRVSDSSALSIVGAQVHLVDLDRGTDSVMYTNNIGLYSFPHIRPGHYRMQVSASGFRVVDLTSLNVNTQDTLEQNFKMAVGSAAESITVEGKTTPVDFSGGVGTVIDQTLVQHLPLNGRSFQGLIQLSPGVVTTPTDNNNQGQFSVNGQRTNTNYFSVDGVSANAGTVALFSTGQSFAGATPAFSVLGGTNTLVSTEAVQEFGLQTSSYAPEFGRSPGAQVSIVTRSGTNTFHGTTFEYLRNDVLDANDWFANRHNLRRAALRQNDFGQVVGGPLKRNKTFFFISYEGLRLRQPTTGLSDVPTAAARQAAPGSLQPFFNAYPLPTGADEGNGLAPAVYGFSNPATLNAASIKIDHHINDSLSIFGRYNYAPSDSRVRGAAPNALSNVTNTSLGVQTATLAATLIIRPTVLNDVRFNWTKASAASFFEQDDFGGASVLPSIIPSPFSLSDSQESITLSLQGMNTTLDAGRVLSNLQYQYNLVDTLSLQFQAHILKMGFDYRRLDHTVHPFQYSQTAFFSTIASTSSLLPVSGQIFARESVAASFVNYSLYCQDSWKLTPRLNITYGLRWDYNPAPNPRDQQGLAPFVVQGFDSFPSLSVAQNGTAVYNPTANNLAPRLGLAYSLRSFSSWDTVIRAGAGVFYDMGNTLAGQTFTRAPFLAQTSLGGHVFPYSAADSARPLITLNPPFAAILTFPPTLRTPYTYEWNASVQQFLGNKQTITVGYVGASGHSMLNPGIFVGGEAGVSPQFAGGIAYVTNSGKSNYHAVQAQYRRRTDGLDILASYTLSHSLDNLSSETSAASPTFLVNPRFNYASSDFDIRQTVSLAVDYKLPTLFYSRLGRITSSGWGVDLVATARSSPPVDVIIVRDIGFGTTLFRPDVVSGIPLYIEDPTLPGRRKINPAAFSVSGSLRQGTLGRNSFRGFPLFQEDLALHRTFRLADKFAIEAQVEAFNLFNHPNFAPEANLFGIVAGSRLIPVTGFGVSSRMLGSGLNTVGAGTGFSSLYQLGGPRTLQLALRLEF